MAATIGPRLVLPTRCPAAEEALTRELGLSPILGAVLVARGFDTPEAANTFLNPSLNDLGDPMLLPDCAEGVRIIMQARESKDLIFVHGDYDADGVTSASLFGRFLTRIGCNVHVHVPHRMKEGYGIHADMVDAAHEMGAKVLLTCDCGVSAIPQIEKAREFGMLVVVTDHHQPGEKLPRAHAIINPHREGSQYPFSDLAGVAVVFRFCEQLCREAGLSVDAYRRAYLDITAIGTVADMMPLTGENRIIVRHGLAEINRTRKLGLKALLEAAELSSKRITAGHIGFNIGPRLNAAGRIDDAALSLQLLLTESEDEARQLAGRLETLNRERKEMLDISVEQAAAELADADLSQVYAIVQHREEWHPGLIGLIASRIKERFYRPTFVLCSDPETGDMRASARSTTGFNVVDSITALGSLVCGGGHAKAGGFSARREDLDAIARFLRDFAEKVMTPEDLFPRFHVDMQIASERLTVKDVAALSQMEPFGSANPSPLFQLQDAKMIGFSLMNKGVGKTLVELQSGDRLSMIQYQCAEQPGWFVSGETISPLGSLELNEYRDTVSVQLKMLTADSTP